LTLFRYDTVLILSEIYKLGGVHPELTANGNKLYKLVIPKKAFVCPRVTFKDSFNWIPLPLGKMPRALGLSVRDKPFFPYRYNQNANLHVELTHLPAWDYYNSEIMTVEKQREFDAFYMDNFNTPFCLKRELLAYCMNDVAILAEATITMERLLHGITGDSLMVMSRPQPLASGISAINGCRWAKWP